LLDQEDGLENIIPYEGGNYNWVTWASNDRILASVRSMNFEARGRQRKLLSMHWNGTDQLNPNKFQSKGSSYNNSLPREPQIQDQIIDILRDDPDHVLIQMGLDTQRFPSVYKLNIKTRKRTQVLNSKSPVGYWVTDKDHVVRYGEGYIESSRGSKNIRHVALYRKSIDAPWHTLFDYQEIIEPRPFYFEGFSADPNIVFVSADDKDHGKRGLYTYNVNNKKIVEKIVGSSEFDIVDVSINEAFELDYYSYYREKAVTVRLSEMGQRLDKLIAKTFPDKTVAVISQTKDQIEMILSVEAPHSPQSYYYINSQTGDYKQITQTYRGLDHSKLAQMTPITYTARDGLEIPGYLMLPKGGSGKNMPMVVMPHGGPMARDGWAFDYWAQFLTTRGIAVLQMNYRGSTGYGEEYRMLGYHEWGRKMLEDINDGAKWMVSQGYTDPERMCVIGWSYGGYAALQSIVKDQSLYKCSVAMAPVTDLDKERPLRKA
ncbi:MAG: prolyl oligopeptidase family serine peptidase, partial [Emcibacteraceae bacterium]|nr:prolyl oligopeptidase family serine peptidase [Emcibacteraceae bacterium]